MVRHFQSATSTRRPDDVVVEEPMEIQLDGNLVSTTMRTPGHDFELAVGFAYCEGLLDGHGVTGVRYCAAGSAVDTEFNVVTVETGGKAPVARARLVATSSSCGLCGSDKIDELCDRLTPISGAPTIDFEVLASMPDRARSEQILFAKTGGVHAAAAFSPDGSIVVLREDIGRHNAVDKVVGHLLLTHRLPAGDFGLFVSGRASFEMVQKAWAAGFGTVVAVSAPSALAIETAERANITLAGFIREAAMNLYSPR